MQSIEMGCLRAALRWVTAGCMMALAACSAEDTSSGGPRSGSGAGGGATGATDPFGNSGAAMGSGTDFGNTTAGASGAGGTLPNPDDVTCAQGVANANPVTPTVWLVIDSSGSMEENFNGPTRWEALRAALMDPGGIVERLQSSVRFGMVMYNGPENGGAQCMGTPNLLCGCIFGFEPVCCEAACGGTPPPPPAAGECANLVTVDPALDNYANISAAYPQQQIGGWTPTDRAVEHVVANLPVLNQVQLDVASDPVYVILATDGAPNDNCGGVQLSGSGASQFQPEVAQRVLDAVVAGVAQGMRMFVISLAGGDPELSQHLAEVAAMGDTGQPAFEPTNPDALVQTLQQIIGGASCQVALNGTVTAGQECTGEVTLNGFPLGCNAPDGWRMVDESTVQLEGSACDMFLSTPSQVFATFPCGVFIPG